jgi:hypothetical protein
MEEGRNSVCYKYLCKALSDFNLLNDKKMQWGN